MSYKLNDSVKVISITHQFSIEDATGKIYSLRKWENMDIDEGGYYLLDENQKYYTGQTINLSGGAIL